MFKLLNGTYKDCEKVIDISVNGDVTIKTMKQHIMHNPSLLQQVILCVSLSIIQGVSKKAASHKMQFLGNFLQTA